MLCMLESVPSSISWGICCLYSVLCSLYTMAGCSCCLYSLDVLLPIGCVMWSVHHCLETLDTLVGCVQYFLQWVHISGVMFFSSSIGYTVFIIAFLHGAPRPGCVCCLNIVFPFSAWMCPPFLYAVLCALYMYIISCMSVLLAWYTCFSRCLLCFHVCGGAALCPDVLFGCEPYYCLQRAAGYIRASYLDVLVAVSPFPCYVHHWLCAMFCAVLSVGVFVATCFISTLNWPLRVSCAVGLHFVWCYLMLMMVFLLSVHHSLFPVFLYSA